MRSEVKRAIAIGLVAIAASAGVAPAAEPDGGVIRLAEPTAPPTSDADSDTPAAADPLADARRGFNVEAFDGRLEGLWFQRKAYERDGRTPDVQRQSTLIRDFVAEEGVRRLQAPAAALVLEAHGWLREGNAERALSALTLAEALDPNRGEIRLARAQVLWKTGAGPVVAGTEWLRAVRDTVKNAVQDLTLIHESTLLAIAGALAAIVLVTLLLMLRYQRALRHDVEEWMKSRVLDGAGPAAGWVVLLLPFLTWIGAGWAIPYWLVVTFRYARRTERVLVVGLLVALAGLVPAYRFAIGMYGLAADPTVRTTIDAANGAYDPDRIVKLRDLVDAHPDDPMYRFLLAGLYKNGRYFEEAFREYKQVLEVAPSTYQARINLGNIYFMLGQYGEAISNYRKALDLRPDSVLAYYDMYLAQSDSFKLKEAGESLQRARDLDPAETNRLLTQGREDSGGPKVVDAVIDFDSIWRASVEGRHLREWLDAGPDRSGVSKLGQAVLNPLSLVALASLLACGAIAAVLRGQPPARACLRCGRPFCAACRTGRDGHEYCSQCVHLFVLGDGLSPETKRKKLYEVERHETRARRARRVLSLVLPGASQLLSGRVLAGAALLAVWATAWVVGLPEILGPLQRVLDAAIPLAGLRPGPVPAVHVLEAATVLAAPVAVVTWLAANLGALRTRGA